MIDAHLLNERAALNGDSDISDPPDRKGLWVNAFPMPTVPLDALTSTEGIVEVLSKNAKGEGGKGGVSQNKEVSRNSVVHLSFST